MPSLNILPSDGSACYKLINKNSGKALVTLGTTSESNVCIKATTSSPLQNWFLRACQQELISSPVRIESAQSEGYYITIADESADSEANAQMQELVESNSQIFALVYDDYSGYYTIVNYNSGRVLDAARSSNNNGTNVWQYTSNSTPAQWWNLNKNANGTYTFASAINGAAVQTASKNIADGTNVELHKLNGTTVQQFTFIDATPYIPTEGSVSIQSGNNSSLVFDIPSSSTQSATNIQLYSSNGTFAQKYMLKANEDGTYAFRSIASGLYVSTMAEMFGATLQTIPTPRNLLSPILREIITPFKTAGPQRRWMCPTAQHMLEEISGSTVQTAQLPSHGKSPGKTEHLSLKLLWVTTL